MAIPYARDANGPPTLDPKDPDAVEPITIDWAGLTNGRTGATSDWLESGETISTSTWIIAPSGTLTADSDTNTDTTATVVLSAGTVGITYTVTNRITTTGVSPARTMDRSFYLPVRER